MKPSNNRLLTFFCQTREVQALKNTIEKLLPKKEFDPMVYVWVITNGGEVLGGKDWYWQIHKWQRWSKTCLQFGSLMSLSLHRYFLSQGDYKGAPDSSQNSYFGYKWVFGAGRAAGWTFSEGYTTFETGFFIISWAKQIVQNLSFFKL